MAGWIIRIDRGGAVTDIVAREAAGRRHAVRLPNRNTLLVGAAQPRYDKTICGGSGAGPGFDGSSAVRTHMTTTRMTDPTMLTLRVPAGGFVMPEALAS